ncbi:BamA/TamA family outer membrane protein [candidate division KSB3 bacterium]|uniref:BamA/TamA family outer membrane protein n=1 Tax=candidate division KSB3 bacterium TaxID=2044937 RepID=A0A9D5JT24_9BACT|nr:BamA/TamA family outer membrane protein [candidate division KSB3 bacterium]MBD3323733.1 BamA/TamA family outer membrane protein [candidate division KSB3 bacterium]
MDLHRRLKHGRWMKRTGRLVLVAWICAAGLICGRAVSGEAQLRGRFGKNKVHYKDFHWATLETTHFTIYFYRGEEPLAQHTARMAERAYQHLSQTLAHQFTDTIPLIIYASSDDFQQTEVVPGFLGEGIGGVTESLKGRIVLPFLGSYRSFNHVLIHELVHAFQFDMLSGGGPAISILSSLSIPLWFMEGMAEYLSEYANPLTDMWLRDAIQHETLPEAKQIESIRDIRAYRFGQSLWTYICDTYGEHIIGDLLRELAENQRWNQAIQETVGTSWNAIYTDWLERITTWYDPIQADRLPLPEQAQRLIAHKKDEFSLNIIPAVSPDGKHLAFVSDREYYRTIYLASAETGTVRNALVEGERRGTFESLRFLNTSITWSPDSQHIAFNARAGGENAIYLLNIASGDIVKKLSPEVVSLSFIAWSPDNRWIAFTGTKHGQEDLFLIDIETAETVQLTDDLYSNRHPAWSPDGTALAFSTDAGPISDAAALKFGPSNLAVYELPTGLSYRVTETAANDFTPVWSPDGSALAFISDRTGICNVYLLEMAKNRSAARLYRPGDIRQVTDVTTGIVGLTEDNPALTWAQETQHLFFSGFSDRGWDIFVLEQPQTADQEDYAESPVDGKQRPDSQQEGVPETVKKKDWGYPLPCKEEYHAKTYHARLTPEYILGGGGGTDEEFVLLARLGFSDMLANHRLTLGLNFTEVFDESDFLVAYSNRAHRLTYEVTAFQFGEDIGTFSMEDADLDIEVQRGAGVNFSWPFDKFRRVEFGLEGWMVSGDRIKHDETEELDDQYFVTPMLAYVHDTTLYTPIGPLDGRRARLSLHPAVGDFRYLSLAADTRWYVRTTRRSTLALRLLGATSLGENARIFEIGGPNSFRAGDFDDEDDEDAEDVQGTNILLGNIEYRFPLLPKVNFLRGTIFWDMSLGWSDEVQPFTSDGTDFVRFRDLRGAYGAGIRIPLSGPFGLINVRVDVAQETDLTRNIGNHKVLFSIGHDF